MLRLDEIPQIEEPNEITVDYSLGGAMRFSDLPSSLDNPEKIRSDANTVYDISQQEKITLDAARKQWASEQFDEQIRRSLYTLRLQGFDIDEVPGAPDDNAKIMAAPEFSASEFAEETLKSVKGGILGLAKVPGVLLKAYGESIPTESERREQREKIGVSDINRPWLDRKLEEASLFVRKSTINAGNSIIKRFNKIGDKYAPSDEAVLAMGQPFMEHPFFRTAVAVGQSAPSYGIAVASTLMTKNPDLGLAILGTSTATDTYESLRNEGIDPDTALYGSMLTGSIEAFTEKIPLDILLKGGGKSFLTRFLKSGTAESFQELISQMGQNYVTSVAKEQDPEKKGFEMKAAQQKWDTIINGWQDAMASGFTMGGGAAIPTVGETQVSAKEAFFEKADAVKFEVQKIVPEKPEGEQIIAKETARIMVEGIKGTGEQKPLGLSLSVEESAVEKALIESFGDLPTYSMMKFKDIAPRVVEFINSEPERAMRVALSLEDPPAGLYAGHVFTAIRNRATMEGNVDVLEKLTFSKTADIVRVMGQQIKSFDSSEMSINPIKAIKEVSESRAKRGKTKYSKEEFELLQKRLDAAEKALSENITKKRVVSGKEYGASNRIVKQSEYQKILERRKKSTSLPGKGKHKGAAYVPTPQDFTDLAKIVAYHTEAIGRNLAEVTAKVIADLGEWAKPYIEKEYRKAIAVLDVETESLKRERDEAKMAFKSIKEAKQGISEEEIAKIVELAKITIQKRDAMLDSKRRQTIGKATQLEMEYGVAHVLYKKYVKSLKGQRTFTEILKSYIKDPIRIITDIAGVFRSLVAAIDNSFIGRQGLKLFYKGLTLDVESAKIWASTFVGSHKAMIDTFRKLDSTGTLTPMDMLEAMIISDPDYETIRRTKVALMTVEEEIPSDLPTKIPILGYAYKATENAFNWSATYMRYRIAKMYINIWARAGKDLNDKREAESIGKITNSMTLRGKISSEGVRPGLLNNIFFSPRALKGDIDFIIGHFFDPNLSAFAKKQVANNLLRYIIGASEILLIADFLDDDSVTWDTNNSDLGKIKIGNSRFPVGGGIPVLIVLASRILTKSKTNSITGEKKELNTGKYGQQTTTDLIYSFLENKMSPAATVVKELLDNRTREGTEPTLGGVVYSLTTSLSIQTYLETQNVEDSANMLSVMIAEWYGVGVQSYDGSFAKDKKEVTW